MLLLIRRYLQAGMMEGGLVSPRMEGTPQGGPLSPLLSNVLLDELDKELERRGHRFVRYADDSNVYVQSEAAGERVMASLERFLREATPAADQPRQERGGATLGTEVPGVQRDVAPGAEAEGGLAVDSATEGQASADLAAGTRAEPPRRHRGTQPRDSGLGGVLPAGRGQGRASKSWTSGCGGSCAASCGASGSEPRTRAKKLRQLGLDADRARASASNGRGPGGMPGPAT